MALGDAMRWSQGLARELALLPRTIRNARLALAELASLPAEIAALRSSLERTMAVLEAHIPGLGTAVGGLEERITHLDEVMEVVGERLPMLGDSVAGISDRFVHLDTNLTELSATLDRVIGRIPGVRSAVRK